MYIAINLLLIVGFILVIIFFFPDKPKPIVVDLNKQEKVCVVYSNKKYLLKYIDEKTPPVIIRTFDTHSEIDYYITNNMFTIKDGYVKVISKVTYEVTDSIKIQNSDT